MTSKSRSKTAATLLWISGMVLFFSCHDAGSNGADTHAVPEDGHARSEEADVHEDEHAADAEAASDVIQVSADWEKLIGLETTPVKRMTIDAVLVVPGQIVPNENQVAVISPYIESSVNSVLVNIGSRVRKGDILVCLTSPEVGVLRAEHEKAKAELEIAHQNLERRRNLRERDIISEKSYQEAQLAKQLAEASYKYTLKKLRAMGVEPEEIEHPPEGHQDPTGSTVHIHAPISGTITYRNAAIGQKVDSSTKLFEIINLENVWLDADIFEKDLTRIKLGQKVMVGLPAYPGETFTGEIFYIGDTVSAETKTFCLKAEIDNRSRKLKPGMFADTRIIIGKKSDAWVVPKRAVLTEENKQIVFVAEGGGYHRHVVSTGLESGEFLEITSGLSPDAVVVVSGHYQLLSQSTMSGVDPHAGHHH